MSRYDDEQIVALLHDAVPSIPQAPDRVAAIRHRAGRQRATLWTQTLGAVASVVMIVGLAAAVSAGTTQGGVVRPTDDPLAAFADAFSRTTSFRFEASMAPVGEIDAGGMDMTSAQVKDFLTSSATGAFAKNGDMRIEGDLSFLDTWSLHVAGDEPPLSFGQFGFRVVDGTGYRSVHRYDQAPKGKKWVRTEGESEDLQSLAPILATVRSMAKDVRYVRSTTVRGTPVAEYRFDVDVLGQRVEVTFALDAASRLRRATGELSWRGLVDPQGENPRLDPMRVRIQLLVYGYGDDVRISAPPKAEVIDEYDLPGRTAEPDGVGFADSSTDVSATLVPIQPSP